MAFTAKDVAALRERTGCGMMDCKKALTETNGDAEKAIEYLREKGLAAAQKKSSRIAAEGVVSAYVDGKTGVVIEVNSESDFVANNEKFKEFVLGCAKTVAETKPADVEELLTKNFAGTTDTVEAVRQEKVLTIGENLNIRRFVIFEGVLETYIHMGGKIGVMLLLDTDDATAAKPEFKAMAKNVCMQIAAMNPGYCKKDEVPAEVIENEKKILKAQAMEEGKPEAIAEKMVMGRIQKFYKENCLVEQEYVIDNKMNVSQYVESVAKELGAKIEVVKFVRLEKGEGLQKKEDNFADEVASMIK